MLITECLPLLVDGLMFAKVSHWKNRHILKSSLSR